MILEEKLAWVLSVADNHLLFLIINYLIQNWKILKLESIPTMRNPPSTQIITKYPNSHKAPKAPK